MAQENKKSSFKDEDYDVILENESCASEIVRVIATIVLTAAVVSGIGYVAHLNVVDRYENGLKSEINRLEGRIIAEIRAARGEGIDGTKVQVLEAKLKQTEMEKQALENKITSLSSPQATSSESTQIEDLLEEPQE